MFFKISQQNIFDAETVTRHGSHTWDGLESTEHLSRPTNQVCVMSEPYIVVSDQEEDWKPVIKNFVSECALQELIDIKKERPLIQRRHEWDKNNAIVKKETFGAPETRIVLGAEALRLGYIDIKHLFNDWFNRTGLFWVENPYKKY